MLLIWDGNIFTCGITVQLRVLLCFKKGKKKTKQKYGDGDGHDTMTVMVEF
jgi:hypothetical protein